MEYYPRNLEAKLLELLKIFPAVSLTGPHQSGKTTLVRHALPGYDYVSFDNYQIFNKFQTNPGRFIQEHSGKTIFDEVQKVPELFDLLKLQIESNRDKYGQFVLVGSCDLAYMRQINQSLAGMLGTLNLFPLQFNELPENAKKEPYFHSSFPELVTRDFKGTQEWLSSYINTFLKMDVRDFIKVENLNDFQRFIYLLGHHIGQPFNMSTFAKALGVTVQTIKRWTSVLIGNYLLFLLPPYYQDFGQRVRKSPKIYLYDNGLTGFLMGFDPANPNQQKSKVLFENYIVSEILKNQYHSHIHTNCYYRETSNGLIINVIVDHKQYLEFIKTSYSDKPPEQAFTLIQEVRSENDVGHILYTGPTQPRENDLQVLNYREYLTSFLHSN